METEEDKAQKLVDFIYDNIDTKKKDFIKGKIDEIPETYININGQTHPPLSFLLYDLTTIMPEKLYTKYIDVYEYLLSKKMNINTVDRDNTVLIDIIVGYNSEDDSTYIIKFLIEHGANIEAKTTDGKTSLHIACQSGHMEIITYLIEHGANVEAKTTDGKTPLHIACQSGHMEIITYLIEHGANIEATTTDGKTPLHSACQLGKYQIIKLLIEHGANVEAKTTDGKTPIQFVSPESPEYSEIIRYMKKLPEIIILTGKDENTCMNDYMFSVAYGYDEGEGLQLKNKIDILTTYWKSISDTVGCDIAFIVGHTEEINATIYKIIEREINNKITKRKTPLIIFKVACMIENNMLEINTGNKIMNDPTLRDNTGSLTFNIAIIGFYGLLQNQFLDLILCSKSKESKLHYKGDYTLTRNSNKLVEPLLHCNNTNKECCDINKRLIRAQYRKEFPRRECKLINQAVIIQKVKEIIRILPEFKDNKNKTYTIDPTLFNKTTFSFSYEDKKLEDVVSTTPLSFLHEGVPISKSYGAEFKNSRDVRKKYAEEHSDSMNISKITSIETAEAQAEARFMTAIEQFNKERQIANTVITALKTNSITISHARAIVETFNQAVKEIKEALEDVTINTIQKVAEDINNGELLIRQITQLLQAKEEKERRNAINLKAGSPIAKAKIALIEINKQIKQEEINLRDAKQALKREINEKIDVSTTVKNDDYDDFKRIIEKIKQQIIGMNIIDKEITNGGVTTYNDILKQFERKELESSVAESKLIELNKEMNAYLQRQRKILLGIKTAKYAFIFNFKDKLIELKKVLLEQATAEKNIKGIEFGLALTDEASVKEAEMTEATIKEDITRIESDPIVTSLQEDIEKLKQFIHNYSPELSEATLKRIKEKTSGSATTATVTARKRKTRRQRKQYRSTRRR